MSKTDTIRSASAAVLHSRYVPLILILIGLTLISAAAWVIYFPAGLAVTGVSCFLFEHHLSTERRNRDA